MTLVHHGRPGFAGIVPPARTLVRAAGHGPRIVAAVAAVGLLLVSLVLPLWQARLAAPQYPGGLVLRAYGGEVGGDVFEINTLNHYVGMRPFDAADIPELKLWLPSVLFAIALVGVATFGRRRWLTVGAKVVLWAIPVGVLADIQFRLWQYGHDINPDAALRIEEFTPRVLGPTKVWNFRTTALPGLGLVAVGAAAFIVTFGPLLWRHLRHAVASRRAAAAGVAGVALLIATALPAAAQGSHQHDGHVAPSEAPTTQPADAGELEQLLRDAPDGATVVVPPGVHRGPLVLDRPVILDGRGAAVIDGGGDGTVVNVRAPDTVVTGLVIRGSGRGPVGAPTGILAEADDVHVHGNRIEDIYHGITVQGASGVQVHDNVVVGRGGAARGLDGDGAHDTATAGAGDGISLWSSSSALVRDNVVSDVRDGVYLSFGREIMVDRNTVTASRFGVHHMYTSDLTVSENRFERGSAGLVLMYGGPVFALRNIIIDNRSSATGYGILVKDVVDVALTENVVVGNRVGIEVETVPAGSDDAVDIIRNTVAGNRIALLLAPSIHADIGGNSFVDNAVSLSFTGGRGDPQIDWLYKGAGNYWSDYRGVDSDGDGIGERPHDVSGGVERLLERAPQLDGLAGSAAMRVLRVMEDRFDIGTPLSTDRLPLVRPVSPALPGTTSEGPSPLGLALAGVLVAGSLAAWHALRRPRTGGPVGVFA